MKKNKKRPRQANKAAQKKQKNRNDFFPEEPGFSFVAGYTDWGFPYGTRVDNEEEDSSPLVDAELPF